MARSEWVRWGGLAALGAGALAILYFLLSLAVGKGDQPGPWISWTSLRWFSK